MNEAGWYQLRRNIVTYSSAWIAAGDDKGLAAFLARSPRAGVLPPPPAPYWINHVRELAKRESLPIEHSGDGEIRVKVTGRQLKDFINAAFGPELQADDPSTLLGYVMQRCLDDSRYVLAAEEF